MPVKFDNMLVTGGAFNIAEGDFNFHITGKSTTDRGIDRLFNNVAPGAFHNSGERFDPPKCHLNTRVVVIQEILDWLDDPHSSELVMWLHGAAGAGKSAIAQTIAQILFERGRLSGSFFFARGNTTGRGDEKRLVPTLAFQLAKYLRETRAHIAMAVVDNPDIFDLSLHSQVQDLLIDPLQIISDGVSSSSNDPPRLFIIDGLDECRDPDVQCHILQEFAAAMKSIQHHIPHKLLIASRSEIHLLAGFNEHNTAAVCRRLPLDNNYLPNNDIRLYLQDTFSKIKREHHLRASLDNPWPSKEDISSLVMKSSGQFIYASTVVKYVTSPRHHPAERLKIILGLKTAGRNDRPFAALDSLYTHIFQNVEDIELLLCILRMDLAGSFAAVPRGENKAEVRRNVLGMTVEEFEMALGDLISVVSFDRTAGWFGFLHASIPDFLLDPHRSGAFYVDQPKVNLYRAERCVQAICGMYIDRPLDARYSMAWFYLFDCIERLVVPTDKELLYQSLSSLDMRPVLDHYFLDLGTSPGGPRRYIGRVLLWCLQEHQTHPENASLSKLTHEFDFWFLSHLQSVSINGFDNKLGIDLMVFELTEIDGDQSLLKHRLHILGISFAQLVDTWEILSPRSKIFPWYMRGASPHSEYFTLLRYFFHDHKRSGKYFMSGDRYANGALHCVNFLFDTRRTDTVYWDEPRWLLERETLYLAMEYVTFFLGKATAEKILFELLLGGETIPKDSSGISSFISTFEINARCRLNSRIDVIFSNGQRTSCRTSLGARGASSFVDGNFLLKDKNVAEWREKSRKSVQMVVTAMSEYVSTKCQSLFSWQNSKRPR